MTAEVDDAPATPTPVGELRVELSDGREALVRLPIPVYAQDIVRIAGALVNVWGQMPPEPLPDGKPLAAARLWRPS